MTRSDYLSALRNSALFQIEVAQIKLNMVDAEINNHHAGMAAAVAQLEQAELETAAARQRVAEASA
jgi:hypothetical protein